MGASAAQKKLFFKLRRTKAEISALEEGDLRPEHARLIAERLGVEETDVIEMNRRLECDASLNIAVHKDGDGEWQDRLIDPTSSPQVVQAEREESEQRRSALIAALDVLTPRERDILVARRLSEIPVGLEQLVARYGVSRERRAAD